MRVFLSVCVLSLLATTAMAEPMRTVKVTPEKAATGAKLFSLCAPCHGVNGKDRVARAADLTSKTFLEAASDAFLTTTIKNGRPGTAMVAWSNVLDDAQVEALVAYLRHTAPTEAAKLDESPSKGDAGEGAKIFMKSCVLCHNMAGGHREWGTGILRKAFLSQVSNGYMRYIITKGKSGTAMQGFAGNSPLPELNLNASQVEHVIAFLREGL
jgi:mono/diheme cytochrome c family protein